MTNFNEHALEMSIMELFKDEGYIHLNGSQIHRERTEVLLQEDLKQYLYNRYAKDGITPGEVDGILLMLRNISGTLYEANKAFYKLLCDGFILNREDRTQKDIYIELIDFDTPENVWFVDGYARTFPTEDRARLFEYMFMPQDDSVSRNIYDFDNLVNKAKLYSYILRQCFPSCNTETSNVWEKNLGVIDSSVVPNVETPVPVG